jgi:hypothetical protein
MANTSDSNNILKTILIIIVVVAIAYIIYYLYTQNSMNKGYNLENYADYDEQSDDGDDNEPVKEQFSQHVVHENRKPHVPIENFTQHAQHSRNENENFQAQVPPNLAEMNGLQQFPKDQLTADELLPKDNSSLWAQVNPSGEGSLKDRNFLQSGYHIGINTVGQTLRNGNLQLRSEPPCPQVRVSPWLQSTIEPDLGRKPFEIGGCA